MPQKKTIDKDPIMAEQEKLIEILKFTPRAYKIQMWGYGGEYVMGRVDRKIYDYFKQRRLSVSDYAWDDHYADENNIPEHMQPFPAGSWYDCDGMAHCHGVDKNCGTIQITDEQDQIIYERSLEDLDGCSNDSPEWRSGDEAWIDQEPAGTVVFIGISSEKGTFFESTIDLKEPFDITKLQLGYDDVDGNEIVNHVSYDGEDIDNFGGSTDGKSSVFGFYIAGTGQGNSRWEKYSDMSDITYPLTDWFPAKINPVRTGTYNIRTPGKDSWERQAEWNGEYWHSTYDVTTELKIKEWRGLSIDPDLETE